MKPYLKALTALVLGGLVGCSTGQPSLEEAQAQVCQNLATFQQNIATLAATSQNSTVGQFKEAQANVARSFTELKESVGIARSIKIDELEQAYQDLDRAVGQVSNDQTIQEAIASVQPAMQNVQAASEQLRTGAACQ